MSLDEIQHTPIYHTTTYERIVCDILPQKAETHRTRLIVDGNLIKYPHNVRTPTSDILTVKCLLNSVISTPNAKFCGSDIKAFISTHQLTPLNHANESLSNTG